MSAGNLHFPTGQSQADRSDENFPILVIYDVIEHLARGEALDLLADAETVLTAQCLAEALRQAGHQVSLAAVQSEEELIQALAGYDPDTTLVFNLVEAMGGVSGGEIRIPALLDRLGFCYTGPTSETLAACLDKAYTKACLLANGIPTAPYQTFHSPHEAIDVPLPAIVKPVAEDCSLGISLASVVSDEPALRRQVAYILETYKQPALVEKYIDGREFKISVWGNGRPYVLPIAEVDFSDWEDSTVRVVNFAAKWLPDSPDHLRLRVICPANLEPQIEARICQVALDAYQLMGCRDYTRIDMRLADGVPYILEINTNPSLYLDSGFYASAMAAGYDYASMAHQIASWAWMRKQRQSRT